MLASGGRLWIIRSEIVEALVIAVMVVVLDEGGDLAFEIAG